MKNKFFIIKFIIILPFFLSFNIIYSQNLSGTWNGYLDFHTYSLKIVLHIEQDKQGLHGTSDSPDQSAYGIPVDTIWYENGYFAFQIRSADIAFTGITNIDFSQIKGTFIQYGGSTPLVLSRKEPEIPKNSLTYVKNTTGSRKCTFRCGMAQNCLHLSIHQKTQTVNIPF